MLCLRYQPSLEELSNIQPDTRSRSLAAGLGWSRWRSNARACSRLTCGQGSNFSDTGLPESLQTAPSLHASATVPALHVHMGARKRMQHSNSGS